MTDPVPTPTIQPRDDNRKFWIEKVIVPILVAVLGGGGIVAIYISFREHPKVTTEPSPSPPAVVDNSRQNNPSYPDKSSNQTAQTNASPANQTAAAPSPTKSEPKETPAAAPVNADEQAKDTTPAETYHGRPEVIFVAKTNNTQSSDKLTVPKWTHVDLRWQVRNLPPHAKLYIRVVDSDGIDIGNRGEAPLIGKDQTAAEDTMTVILEYELNSQFETIAKILIDVLPQQ